MLLYLAPYSSSYLPYKWREKAVSAERPQAGPAAVVLNGWQDRWKKVPQKRPVNTTVPGGKVPGTSLLTRAPGGSLPPCAEERSGEVLH